MVSLAYVCWVLFYSTEFNVRGKKYLEVKF